MWIIIIAIVVIVGIFIFKHFDRDFIKAVHFAEKPADPASVAAG